MIEIPLTKNKIAIVDTEDAVIINMYSWSTRHHKSKNSERFYATTCIKRSGNWRPVSLHRFLMGEPKGMCVDHINGDTLDNRRNNLRIVTAQQNCLNQHFRKGTSVYKGVAWCKREERWDIRIMINGKSIFLGYDDDEKEAALVYDEKAFESFGEYAKLNFPLSNN